MIKAIIVDDEPNARKSLKLLIKEYCPDVTVVDDAKSLKTAVEKIELHKPDLIFLDIELGDGTGFEMLDELSFQVPFIVFTTAYAEHALKAFNYNAVHYLLKPISISNLKTAVKRIAHQLNDNNDNTDQKLPYFKVWQHSGMSVVKLDEIEYFNSINNNVVLHRTDGKEFLLTCTLKSIEQKIEETDFQRVHGSYIVNLKYVSRILTEEGDIVVMKSETQIPISRRQRKEFLDRFLS